MRRVAKGGGGIDPLIVVRRRLREEAIGGSGRSAGPIRSSSAPPADPARNYSRKWRRSQRGGGGFVVVTPPDKVGSKDFFDTASRDDSIEEEEIPDINKFDNAPKTYSDRIRSAAFTTFAWMTLQEEAAKLVGGGSDQGRRSWLLDNAPATASVANVANESKKRTSPVPQGGEGSPPFVKRDDKRDTLEWMGVKPGDFPTPAAAA
jgi:hypothetical protein